MNDRTAAQSVRLEAPEALELCKALRDLRREANEATQALNARYRDEADAMNNAFENRSKQLWDQLYAAAGVDPDLDWTLDTEYLDAHQVAFVKQTPPEPERPGLPAGLAALLGGGVQIIGDEDEEPSPLPTLN